MKRVALHLRGDVAGQGARLEELEAIGRVRALSDAESAELDQLIEWRDSRRRAVARQLREQRKRLERLQYRKGRFDDQIAAAKRKVHAIRCRRQRIDATIQRELEKRDTLCARRDGLVP